MIVQDNIARPVSQLNTDVPKRYLDTLLDFTVGVGGVRRGDTVVEIGASGGRLSTKLRQMGANVIGVDGRFPSGAKPWPLKQGSIDVAFAFMSLHHVKFPSLAISELKKAIKPGGRLVVTDLARIDVPSLKSEHRDHWMGFYTSDIRHWLKKGGFSNIIVNPVPFHLIGLPKGHLDPPAGVNILMATGTVS